jgi:hypothetical protein
MDDFEPGEAARLETEILLGQLESLMVMLEGWRRRMGSGCGR